MDVVWRVYIPEHAPQVCVDMREDTYKAANRGFGDENNSHQEYCIVQSKNLVQLLYVSPRSETPGISTENRYRLALNYESKSCRSLCRDKVYMFRSRQATYPFLMGVCTFW